MGKLHTLSHLIRPLTLAFSGALLLVACSSAPPPKVTPASTLPGTANNQPKTAAQFLDDAARQETQGRLTARNQSLLAAAEYYSQQQNCASSTTISRFLLYGNVQQADESVRAQTYLLLAECELQQPSVDYDKLIEYQAQAQHLSSAQTSYSSRLATVTEALYRHQQQWLAAASSVIQQDSPLAEQRESLWFYLSQLSDSQLDNASLRPGQLQPWLQLAQIARRHAHQHSQLSQQVEQWQQRYASQPLAQALPAKLQQALDNPPLVTERIAVLLPLSGRLQQQGEAVRNGLLSAYFATPNSELVFFDTNHLSDESIAQLADYAVLLGPLLKDNVNKISANLLPEQTLLALNQTSGIDDSQPASTQHYYFALEPESEAQQLASRLYQQGLRRPLLIGAQHSRAQRMLQAFTRHWLSLEKDLTAPQTTRFTNNKTLRRQLTNALDVSQSDKRIAQIGRLTSDKVHSEARNRQDIDSIVVFGDAKQSALLNPMLKSNLNPSNPQKIQLFTSSHGVPELRDQPPAADLNDLRFIQAPWLLPNAQPKALVAQNRQLWPQQNPQLQQLFALGYDAYQLLPRLPQMRHLYPVAYQGLSGLLRVNEAGHIERLLPLAEIRRGQVNRLALD